MKKSGIFLILLAGIFWGTMGIFVNELASLGYSSLQASCIRVTVASILTVITLFLTDKSKFKIKLKDLYLFAILGVFCIYGMSVLYMYTISKTSMSVAAILLYTSPIWVIIFSAIFLKEKITWQKVLAVVLAFIGCAFVSGVGEEVNVPLVFLLTGISSGILYGLYSIFGTVALKKYHPYTVTTYSFAFAALASWFVAGPVDIIEKTYAHKSLAYTLVLIILTGLVTAYAPFMLYTCGLKTTSAGKAAIMASAEPLAATIFGIVIYGQGASLIGIILIMLAILTVNNFGLKK